MKKLCYVATIPAVVHAFLRAHISAAATKYEVTVVCNSVDKHLLADINARFIFLPIQRKPSPWRDALTFLQLFVLFRKERFDIVHSIMPKTGMLAMFVARLTSVPTRIHTFTGQVWTNKQGWKRSVLKGFDRLIGYCSSKVLADSGSQRDFLIQERVISSKKISVIGAGSICGVDSKRFFPSIETRNKVRNDLKIAQDAKVILFVGRLNHDKGILDLAMAFATISQKYSNVVMLLVGSEEDVSVQQLLLVCGEGGERMRYVNFTAHPESYMKAADIFCLPSYREGFGLTLIEAAACGLPAVASRIYGIIDAVEEGKTGLLFPAGDLQALTEKLSRLILNDNLRCQMGEIAHMRASTLFSSEKITSEMLVMYDQQSESRG